MPEHELFGLDRVNGQVDLGRPPDPTPCPIELRATEVAPEAAP